MFPEQPSNNSIPAGSGDWARRMLLLRLSRITRGRVTLTEAYSPGRTTICGDSSADVRATVHIHSPRFYRRMLLGGGLGAAEALMDGDWSCEDLTSLVRIFIRNLEVADAADRGLARCRSLLARAAHWLRKNTRRGARSNIREHYDLGNELFQLFLDETLSYSCGIFTNPHTSMQDASITKMEQVCRRLDLRPSDRLVEIGTGWGGLAIHAARHYGCHVTSTTISQEQYRFARERVRRARLENRINVLLSDYRDLEGQFDKLVSIEMIEAVGHEYFETYFGKCCRLLKPQGHMLLQAIVIKDQRYAAHLKSADFIRKYIFPGGCLPSVAGILTATARATDFRLLHLEDIAPHYAETLRRWRREFRSRIEDVRRLGYSERFIRMWEYYLCYCEAAFEERQVNNVQMVLARPDCRLDPATAYRTTWEVPGWENNNRFSLSGRKSPLEIVARPRQDMRALNLEF